MNVNAKLKRYLLAIALVLSNLVFVANASAQICTNQPAIGLGPNGFLDRGQSLSNSGMVIAHQTDGNVVAYSNGRAVWSTVTAGRATTRLIMQTDGNLVLYGPAGAVWASNTSGANYRYFLMYPKCGQTPGIIGIGNFLGSNNLFFSFKVLKYY